MDLEHEGTRMLLCELFPSLNLSGPEVLTRKPETGMVVSAWDCDEEGVFMTIHMQTSPGPPCRIQTPACIFMTMGELRETDFASSA